MTPLRLGFLDFAFYLPGTSPVDLIHNCVDLVPRLERLGYTRYWLGEHHAHGVAFGSPEILLPLLADRTKDIRIGLGAALLFYQSAVRLAEICRLLESLFPARIDMGLGRGRADNEACHLGLLDGRPDTKGMLPDDVYRSKLDALTGLLRGNLPPEHPLANAIVNPPLAQHPDLWMCGSQTAALEGARLGLPLCLTLFHGKVAPGPDLIESYRRTFRPHHSGSAPTAAIAVGGVCAEEEAVAQRIHATVQGSGYRVEVVGTPAQCRAKLLELRQRYRVDEVIFLDACLRYEDRLKSVELLASCLQ